MATDDDPSDEFERLGENEVRRKLANGEYGSVGERRLRVEAWLDIQAQSRMDASSREQISLARAAAAAARVAADQARKTNTKATIIIGIAIATLIVAIIGLVLS